MEIIYIDSSNDARQTGVRAAMETNQRTLDAFRSAKQIECDSKDAAFLLDYYNAKGDLSDTIFLTREGFERITGEKPKTDAEYRQIDKDFWAAVMSAPTHPEQTP